MEKGSGGGGRTHCLQTEGTDLLQSFVRIFEMEAAAVILIPNFDCFDISSVLRVFQQIRESIIA